MKVTTGFRLLGLVLIIGIAASAMATLAASGQRESGSIGTTPLLVPAQVPPPLTIWDGVYTPAQAERGRKIYERVCSYCHRSDLTGGEAPPLKGAFLLGWRNRPLQELVRFVVNNMPQGSPGTITDQEYLDVISFILKSNLVPASGLELRRDTLDLERVRVTEAPGSSPPPRP